MCLNFCTLQVRPHRQITIDYDSNHTSNSQQMYPSQQGRALSSLGSSSTDNQSSVPNSPSKSEQLNSRQTNSNIARPEQHQSSSKQEMVNGGVEAGNNSGIIHHRRTGSGSSSRDNYRASLRAKHRREMQEKVLQRQQEQQQQQVPGGRTNSANQQQPTSQAQQHISNPSSNRFLGAINKQRNSNQTQGKLV